MQAVPLPKPRITTLTDIELKRNTINELFQQSIESCLHCSDFIQVKTAVNEHFKQAIQYINQCINSIVSSHAQSKLQTLDVHCLVHSSDSLSETQVSLDRIQTQLRDLSAAIDQWVYVIRDCPAVDSKPHVLLLAKAMCEIFEIQHFYIYPFREDLIPDFLKKSNFKRDIDAPIK